MILPFLKRSNRVEIAVRKAGGYTEGDLGTTLMRNAFHVDTGNLTNQSQHRERNKLGRIYLPAQSGPIRIPEVTEMLKLLRRKRLKL